MKPGRELDALVATKVMGLVEGKDFGAWPEHEWKRDEDGEVDIFAMEYDHHNGPVCVRCFYGYCQHCSKGPTQPCEVEPRRYSTILALAWEVLEKIKTPERYVEVISHKGDVHWICRVYADGPDPVAGAGADTPQLAICLAALKLVGVPSSGSPPK